MTASLNFEVWAVEVGGVSTLDTGGTMNSDGTSLPKVTAPKVTPSVAHAFILSSGSSSTGLGGLIDGNPFRVLENQDGEDVAYLITSAAGTYGAEWALSTSGTCNATVTVAFR